MRNPIYKNVRKEDFEMLIGLEVKDAMEEDELYHARQEGENEASND